MLLRFSVVTLGFLTGLLRAEIFTSVQDLTRIFSIERNVVDALENYVAKTEERLHKIRRYLRDYEQVRAEAAIEENGLTPNEVDDRLSEQLAGNPIHAFHLLKRLTIEWKNIEGYDPSADWRGVEEAKLPAKEVEFSQFANEEDLREAAQGIIRLQMVYKLNTTSLVHGNVGGIQTSAEFTAQDCLYLGKNSFNNGLYYNALEWFEQAYILAGLEKNETITQEQASSFIIVAANMYEKVQQMQQTNTETNKDEDASSANAVTHKFKMGEELSDYEAHINYEALCRGEQLLSDAYVASLRCFYDNRNSPYLMLMPAKVELYYHNPEVILFHDAIGEKDIKRLKEFALPKLSRSTVQGPGGKGKSITSFRTSRTASLETEEEIKHFGKLNRHISDLTGLANDIIQESSEVLQVASYGVGGHYYIHRDYLMADKTGEQLQKNFEPKQTRQGDRIATLMFYLSDVTRGGATAFPKLGVTVFPQKGSAIFWYNLKKSGEANQITLHGGCPVIHGVKWISNKWIRFGEQFNRRPCALSEDD